MADWRVLLKEDIEQNPNPSQRREQIERALLVGERALYRWLRGGKPQNNGPLIRRISQVIPGKETEMRESLAREFPNAFDVTDELNSTIPDVIYAEVMQTRALVPEPIAQRTILRNCLQQLPSHLDPDERGVFVILIQCVAPVSPSEPVTTLRTVPPGSGTGAWRNNRMQRAYDVGRETLSGMAVSTGAPMFFPQDIDTLRTDIPIPFLEDVGAEGSAASFPIQLHGKCAGALLVISLQKDFFQEVKQDIITKYAQLISTAYSNDEFYDQFALYEMPPLQRNLPADAQQFIDELVRQHPDLDSNSLRDFALRLIYGRDKELL